jgi:hypothetical protein
MRTPLLSFRSTCRTSAPDLQAQCCLTPRSSGAPTASHQARAAPWSILHRAGLASSRCRPLSSNVRLHIELPWRASAMKSIAVLASLAVSAASAVEPVTPQACLPATHFVLGNIAFADTAAVVRKKLGRPREESVHVSEDDGGRYPVLRYRYDGIEVHIGRDRVERIATRSRNVSLAGRVAVGMSEDQVAQLLRYVSPGIEDAKIVLSPCQHQDGQQLLLTFQVQQSQTRRSAVLTEIELTHYGP